MDQQSGPIVVGGSEDPEPEAGPALRWWAVAGLGVALGLGIGLAFATGAPRITPTTAQEGTVGGVTAPESDRGSVSTSPPPARRLATLVPGMVDALVVVAADPAGDSSVSVWNATEQRPSRVPLPVGPMFADSTHRWLATITESRFTVGGRSLWVGNESYMEPVATEVVGAVWHSRDSGRLAWVTTADGEPVLMVGSFAAGRVIDPVAAGVVPDGAVPVWWTDAGVGVYDPDDRSLRMIRPSGEVTASIDRVDSFVAGGETIAAIVVDGEAAVVDQSLTSISPAPWDSSCVTGAVFEDLVTVVCDSRRETQVWWAPSTEEAELLHTIEEPAMLTPTWTPDGRFVIASSIDPLRVSTVLTFYSPGDGAEHQTTYPGRAFTVETVRTS